MNGKVIKILNELRWIDALKVRNRLEEITYDPMRSQEEFVMRLMRENANTEYGCLHGFENIRNLDDFKRQIPLATYDDYLPYVERIAGGESNVLTTYLTMHVSLLLGDRKIPLSRWGVQSCYDYGFRVGFYIAGNHGYLKEGMTLNLANGGMENEPSGMSVGNLLDRLLTMRDFEDENVYVIPHGVANLPDNNDALHIKALYALGHRDISLVICDHYDNMVDLLQYIEQNWQELADDVERCDGLVQADTERANAIRKIMKTRRAGTHLVTQLWPKLRCIMVHDVGCLGEGFELLRTYCGSNVHFVFSGINAPEGTFSSALNLDDPQTVLIPDSVFYEFKPKEANDYSELLTLDKLKIGRSYELIVTTLSGLYRYKTGKTLLVAGRYHDTPTVIVDKD